MNLNWFLKLKHWQIFLFWIAISYSGMLSFNIAFLASILYAISVVGWIYLIGKCANEYSQNRENPPYLWALLWIIITFIMFWAFKKNFEIFSYVPVMIFLTLLSLFSGYKLISYSATKIYEINNDDSKNQLIIFMFLFPIGVWIIQPKLNKLAQS